MKQLDLKAKLKDFFGFDHFRGQQEAIIKNILKGEDTLVIMPTGAGKSICYQLPALVSEGTCIIVSPLIALMKNQVDAMENQLDSKFAARFLNSSLNKSEITKVKEDLMSGRTKMLYVAPESLVKEENVQLLQAIKISFFAIDEAHCISEWGHDFRPEYRNLRQTFENIQKAPIIALTATATTKVQEDIKKTLNIPKAKVFLDSFNRENLFYEVLPKTGEMVKNIIRIIKDRPKQSGVIYCLSRKNVEELAHILQINGINAIAYHAGLDASTRSKHQDLFLKEEVDVIVATIAFGMGIDKPDIRFVIHYDIPKSLESYYQETGRAGRDGGIGYCVAFYSYKDIEKLEAFLGSKPPVEQEVGKQLLVDMAAFAETSMCRRKYLLYYFGESFDPKRCNEMCDNCKHPKEQFDAQEYIKILLESIEKTKEIYNSKEIINFLMGKLIAKIKQNEHHELEFFGAGASFDPNETMWEAVLRQSLLMGFFSKNMEKQGALLLKEAGMDFMKNPESLLFYKEHNFAALQEDSLVMNEKMQTLDPVLLDMLKDLRKTIANKHQLPSFIIFQEPSLVEMCTVYPISIEELTQISGVGQGKANKFGKPFVELIKKYVEENQIDRPKDIQIKSIAKQGNKIQIIKNIDGKIAMEDTAKMLGLTAEELLSEVEKLVQSGTKININYYIESELGLDKEDVEEIIDFLRKDHSESWENTYKHFKDDFQEDEIRWVRVKFIAEYGN